MENKKPVLSEYKRSDGKSRMVLECPNCDTEVRHSMKYCAYCGLELDWSPKNGE